MDCERFDGLVRLFAATQSRRSALLTLAAAALLGHDPDDAQARRGKRKHQRDHKGRNDKGSGGNGRHRKQRRKKVHAAAPGAKGKCGGKPCGAGNTCLTGGGKPVCCPNARVCGQACLAAPCAGPCQVCDPASGACVNAANGTACDDGDPCTDNDQCTNGACVGTLDPTCAACQSASECTQPPATSCLQATCTGGRCGTANKPAGASCDDGDPCTENDRCDAAGACAGDPVGGCLGCQSDADCAALSVGQCEEPSCTTQRTCAPRPKANGTPCDDDDPCTENDQCTAGVCAGTLRENCVACETNADCDRIAVDQCHRAVCTDAGTCTIEPKPDGAACDDGDPCTVNDQCTDGVCLGDAITGCVGCQTNNDCNAIEVGQCEEPFCTNQNVCAVRFRADGSGCNDGNPCTTDDRCRNGVCAGTPIPDCVPCNTNQDCNDVEVGLCQRAICSANGFCIVEPKANGTACDDGSLCTSGETCQNGVCTPGSVKVCLGICSDGFCDPATGECVFTTHPDNTPCATGRICCGGNCVPNTTTTTCGTCGTQCGANQSCVNGQCGCTNVCTFPLIRNETTCACECPSGTTQCEEFGITKCVNVQTAERHCGACGQKCPTAQHCVAGACVPACAPGTSPACVCSTSNSPGEDFFICCAPHPGGCPDGTVPETHCANCGFSCACTCSYQCCIPGTGNCAPL